MSAASVQLWFHRLYRTLELAGCSSHSGRRTLITQAARTCRKLVAVSATCKTLPDIAALP
jgi:hypothetical protein